MTLQKQPFMGISVNNLSCREAQDVILQWMQEKKQAYVVEVNTDVMIKIEKDAQLKKITEEADLVLMDGQPLVWVSKWYKRPVKEKVSGSDLALALCEGAAKRGCSVFILGGKEGIADQAKAKLEEKFPGIRIVGTYAPPFGFEKDEEELGHIRELISAVTPDLVLTCFGCPKQEKWIYDQYRQIWASVFLCAGATVDFLAGNVKRAPKWISSMGMEWFYRFLKEPKRLFKRYFVDDMKIIGLIWKYRKQRMRR